jgi:hypothetical protein
VTPIHDALALAIPLIFWLIPAILVARLAERRGRRFPIYLIASLVIPWPVVLVVVLVLPRRDGRASAGDDRGGLVTP